MDGEQHPNAELTTRELEVLRLVALGLSNRDVAEELVIAPETVRWYTKQIYSKLGVSGRVQALNRAKELSLLEAGKTVAPPAVQATNLPLPVTPFIGRSREIAEVKQLLRTSRLLTLTGVGGSGKTRLAITVASEVAGDFAGGVYFVDLAPLSNHSLVVKAIAEVLAVIENPAEPLLDTLKRVLAGRAMLLVLDNFEHVIEAAAIVSGLLSVPRLKILVTSREPLHISGEQDYPVQPLSLEPAGDNAAGSEAVALFVQRTMMTLPHFKVTGDNAPAIAEICARLDGLPLAIELAAARCKVLTPQALLTRLDSRFSLLTGGSRDAPHRQQTLRQTLDWSYNLLSKGEKILFARLAIFRGGRSLEAVDVVCGTDLPVDVFDSLAGLVDKSLIQQQETPAGEPRFILLETIHEYALERLAESGEEEAIRRRHAEYFVALAERAEPELRQSQQMRWVNLLELERDNLRAVLEAGYEALGIRLAGALFMYWFTQGLHADGYDWTQRLLPYLDRTPEQHHAKFLVCAGYMLWIRDMEQAKRLLTQAFQVSQKIGDPLHAAWAQTYVSVTLSESEARSVVEEALSTFRRLDYKPGIAQVLNVIGELARYSGDDRRAKQAYEECMVVAAQIGDRRLMATLLYNQSFIAQHEGDHQAAIALLRRSLVFSREMTSRHFMATNLESLAGSLAAVGQPERAVRLLGAAEVAFERGGYLHEPLDQVEIDRIITRIRAQLDPATFETAWAEGRTLTLEQAAANVLDEKPIP